MSKAEIVIYQPGDNTSKLKVRLDGETVWLTQAQMEQLPGFVESKRKLAEKYRSFFEQTDIAFFSKPENTQSNYWLNAVLLKDRKERDEFLEYTNQNGIMTRPVWGLMNRLPMFKDCQTGDLSNAEWLAERVVNIPSSAI